MNSCLGFHRTCRADVSVWIKTTTTLHVTSVTLGACVSILLCKYKLGPHFVFLSQCLGYFYLPDYLSRVNLPLTENLQELQLSLKSSIIPDVCLVCVVYLCCSVLCNISGLIRLWGWTVEGSDPRPLGQVHFPAIQRSGHSWCSQLQERTREAHLQTAYFQNEILNSN